MKLKKTQTSRKELPKTFLDSYFFSDKERGETIWYNENLVEGEVILERGQRYLPTDVRLESSFLRSQVSNQYTLPKRLCNTS